MGRRIAERPMAVLRPRDRLGAMCVFEVDTVLGQAWSPGSQVWQAGVALSREGGILHLARTYDRAAPAALDMLAAALDGRFGAVRQIAGPVRIEAGVLVCDPWSISADRLLVPDLAEPDGPGPRVPLASLAPEQSPLEQAQALLAGALHSGRRAFEPATAGTGQRIKVLLETTGHVATAARLSAWLDARDNRIGSFGAAMVWIAAMAEDPGLKTFEPT
ncbi:hypothetical protein [Lichenifustis flavocetrariae]|uniref:Uncharacterized protein n=1 Tax=Lichenifustis flavocetrariae TaxID=2949735 RepID=A0AA42CKS1_9HYPH|nr:hypothetical protein [Lichenifustis flavocetrariae]MCW6510864.1 hypothetical protein [Lichenifustis flavocetrariae]